MVNIEELIISETNLQKELRRRLIRKLSDRAKLSFREISLIFRIPEAVTKHNYYCPPVLTNSQFLISILEHKRKIFSKRGADITAKLVAGKTVGGSGQLISDRVHINNKLDEINFQIRNLKNGEPYFGTEAAEKLVKELTLPMNVTIS